MRPLAILVVTLAAVLGVLGALPLGEGSSWPCCDSCGACNGKQPPECQCNDVSMTGCNLECKNCVADTLGDMPPDFGPLVIFTCTDVLTNFSQNTCTAA